MDTVEEIVNNTTTTDFREDEIDNKEDESDYNNNNNNGDFNEVETYDSNGDYGSYNNRDYYNYEDDETYNNYDYNEEYNNDETYHYSDYDDDEYNYTWFEDDRFYDAKESFTDDYNYEGYDSDDSEYRYWYDDAKDAFADSDESDGWSDDSGGGGWTDDEWGVGFKKTYLVYPLSHIGRTNLEIGNKIILPLSALTQLMDAGADFPMLFKVENTDNSEKTSHCGVLEFTAEEGEAILPEWMMKNLSLEEGGSIRLENVTLEAATYVKLQPHSMEFLDIRNPKAVLETAFCLGYSCLTVGDTVVILHEGKKLFIDIVDAKPSNAVCVLETDVEVDFALPLDYKEPVKPVREIEEPQEFVPFSGRARRLSDTKGCDSNNEESVSSAFNDDGHKNHVEPSKSKTKIVFGGGGSSNSNAGSNGSEIPSDAEKTFKAFTGNKYRLIDS